jgi:lysozyme
MDYRDILIPQLKIDEAVKPYPYRDSKGILTIGIGRNLEDVGLHADEIDLLCKNDVDAAEAVVRNYVTIFKKLSDVRQAVLVNMAFNLGDDHFNDFVNMLRAVNAEQYDEAARQMENSKWCRQVGARALRLIRQMRENRV